MFIFKKFSIVYNKIYCCLILFVLKTPRGRMRDQKKPSIHEECCFCWLILVVVLRFFDCSKSGRSSGRDGDDDSPWIVYGGRTGVAWLPEWLIKVFSPTSFVIEFRKCFCLDHISEQMHVNKFIYIRKILTEIFENKLFIAYIIDKKFKEFF